MRYQKKLKASYVDNLNRYDAIELVLPFPDNCSRQDMYEELKSVFENVPFTVYIDGYRVQHYALSSEKEIIDTNVIDSTTLFRAILKEEYTIISTEEYKELMMLKSLIKECTKIINNKSNKQ